MADEKSWRDLLEERRNGDGKEEADSKKKTSGWRDKLETRREVTSTEYVGKTVVNRVNSLLNNHNSLISDHQKRYSGRKYSYEDAYVSDSADWMEQSKQRKDTWEKEADDILSYLDLYGGYLDDKFVKNVRHSINSARLTQGKILDAATKDHEWWSGFGKDEKLIGEYGSAEGVYNYYQRSDGYSKKYEGMTYEELSGLVGNMDDGEEKDWLTGYAGYVDYENKKNLDIAVAEQEIAEWENAIEQYNLTFKANWMDYYQTEEERDAYRDYFEENYWKKYGGEDAMFTELAAKRAYVDHAKRIQEADRLSSVADSTSELYDPEFKKYAQQGAAFENPTVEDYVGFVSVGSWNPFGTDPKNKVTYTRDNWDKYVNRNWAGVNVADGHTDPASYGFNELYTYMEEDEVQIYNYYLAKYGEETADKYLDALEETLESRKANGMYERVGDNFLKQWAFAATAGLDQFASGMSGFWDSITGNEEYKAPSAVQQTSGMIREDLKDTGPKLPNWLGGASLGQVLYDETTTAANMAPSILASTVANLVVPGSGAVVGSTLMGTSAAGNAYTEVINMGYGKDEARAYSLMVGVSEASLQYALGGISNLGGMSGKITKAVAGIDNGILRWALKFGGNMASEALEEGLQEILDPLFKNAILHADEDINWSEAAYSALLGGLSGGLFDIPGTTIETIREQRLKKSYGGNTGSIIQEGLDNGVNSESYELATRYKAKTDAGKTLTGAEIRQLLEANQKEIRPNDLYKIQKAAEARLTELGQTEDVSEIARIATKWATGQSLTRSEKSMLANSKYGSRVANEMLPKNIEAGGYTSEWAEKIGTELVEVEAYNKDMITKVKAAWDQFAKGNDPSVYKSLEDRVGDENKLSVSKTGKATISKSGKEIDLSKAEVVDFVKDKETGKVTDMILNVDGEKVKASEIDYADADQSYLYSAVQKIENITPGDAQAIISMYKPSSGLSVGTFLNGIDEAYTYGYHGYSEADMQAGKFTMELSEEMARGAYLLGQKAKSTSKTAKTEAIKRMRTAVEAEAEKAKADGKEAPKAKEMTITYKDKDKVVDFDKAGLKLTTKQKSAPALAKVFHEMGLGTNFELFSSYVNKKGVRVYLDENGVERNAPSGVYRMADGTVRIDLNAYNGRGLTLDVMAHELTHFIQQWSDTKYQALADFLIKTYEKTDMKMHDRVIREQNRINTLRKADAEANNTKYEPISYNEAFDEVVANAMSKMLADGKVMERLNELKAQDADLARKLWAGLKKFLNKFFRVAEKQSALFHDAADIMELKAEFKQMQQLWAEAFVEASENFQASLTEAGIGFDEDTKSVYSLHFSNAYTEQIQVGKKTFDAEAVAQLVSKATNRSIEDARKWVQSEMTIANIVMQNPEFLDFEADNRYEAIKKNSDYPQGTVDLSNLCPKREEFTTMFDMLQKKYPNKLFTAQDVADMRKILSDNDITVACGACFVEDRRQLLGDIADTYINMWKEAVESGKPLQKTNAAGVKSDLLVTKALAKQYGLTAGTKIMATDTYIPTQYDLTTYEGFKKLEKNHPTVAMGFNRYNNSRGQQSARLIEGRAEYNRQILGWSDAKVKSVNNNGGLRIFSFSDFEVVHLLDLVQVIIDCAAKGVKIQGYTKIPAFAKLVRNTGIKINRSLIPKGDYGYHMENGKVVLDYDTTEGIDINDENFVDESNNPNVGNIVIGINPTQIGAAMLDPFIDYVIPFHSNKAKDILRKLGTGEWVNYKESQHEKDIATGTSSKHNVNIYTEVINKYHPTNKVEFVEAFLKECKRQGKIPRYAEFLNVDANGDYAYREGYHKLLVDFKMFDAEGNILPQGNITPNLDENFMKDLLNEEIDKKQNYEFPQEVYDAIDKKFGEKYSSQETDVDAEGFKDYDIVSSVYTIRNEKAKRGQDLVKIGNMPTLYRELFGLSGDVYVSNEHLYQNMVSKATAEAEGRYQADDSANYHELGEEKVINAIEQFQDPLVIMESLKDYAEPRLVAVLDEKGNDGENLIAVLELYSKQRPLGVSQKRNHVLITIYEKNSLPDYIEKTVDKNRILHIKEGSRQISQAGLQLAGEISAETLKKNVAQFNKKVKAFKEKNDIRYSTQETDDISNRDLLANAFEMVVKDSEEYKLIQKYKGHIKLLNEYEEKLSNLNAEIRKMLFDPNTERDAKKLKELQTEAKKVAGNINRHDRELLSLEASEPLRKVIEQERKKASQKTKDHVKELLQNKKARAEQTELRHKIRKAIRDLDKLLNRGNKKLNVKEDMKSFVSKALELADYLFTDHISNDDLIRNGIDADLVTASGKAQLVKETEDILTKLYDGADSLTDEEFTKLDAKRKANEDKMKDLLTAQRNRRLDVPVYNLFNDLVTEYASLKNSSQDSVKAAYSDDVERLLRTFIGDDDSDRAKALKNMRVADMTTEELWKLHNAYTMVLTTVRDANKFHVSGMNASIEQVVGQIAGDFGSRKIPEKALAIALQKIGNKIGWNYEKLYYALDRIGSEAFTKLIMNLADSENIVMQDVIEALAFRDAIVEKYGFNNWDINKKIDREFLDNTGKKFKLTLGELMSLYAYSRREGAWDHIEYGGFVFGEAALTDPKPADSYKLSKEQCEAITNLLTKEQKSYVEDMQKFLSDTMGAKGNEVSMKLYGIKMFGEKNYFPIHIAGQFKAQAQESQAKAAAGFGSMSNAGFTHAQNPNAKAPFVMEGFNEVWSDHVNEMSRYHGTVPALEDIRRVMNRSTYSDSVAESQSIKQLMENHFGKSAVDYFDNLYREANSGAITDKLEKKSKKLLSLFRKNSVAYSLSVLIQQPASIVRAYALIDKKYFGFKGFGTITSGIAKAVSSKWNPAYANAYNEMLKYAPGVTMAKEIGGFDTATGGSIRSYLLDTNKSFGQKVRTDKHGKVIGFGKALYGKVDDNAIANLPNVADKIAWIEIWNACKREAVATHKNLAPNSEEFMQAVGERFTEVIRATQVYDSIFAKSPMLKSKNLAVQYLVSFMNEPNTVANMAEKAVRDAKNGNWKGGLRTGAAVIYSIIFTNMLKSIIYAMRDDDEDETYIEKYIEALVGGMMDDFNALNYIPLVKDVWSVAQGYDVERADMAIVADAVYALSKVIKYATTNTDDMTEEQLIELDKKQTEAGWKLVESVASFFGIPIKNIRREVNGILDHARIASTNAGMTTVQSAWDKVSEAVIESIPFMGGGKSKTDKIYTAIIDGDTDYLERLKSTYKTEDAYQSAVRKALRENDPRIRAAAQAKYEGNTEEYKRIFREIQSEGNFSFDDIMSAINTELSKLTPDKVTGDYTASGYVEAIIMGNTSDAEVMKDDIIATKVANGKTQEEAEKEFSSNVTTGIRDAYASGLLDEAGAEKMLVEYAGKDEDEATSKVRYWAFCEEHPEQDFSESNVNDYYEFAEPAGISVEVYAQFIEGTKGLSEIKDEWGDVEVTKREQVLEVIDSLPLTWQQKDALYLAAGYSESKIWDVPW
ncbi:MAG: hypothetical protein IKW20_05430 [Bacteroidales bacterium]|nr:hypothetical protein [Bacteroidales bacterium]